MSMKRTTLFQSDDADAIYESPHISAQLSHRRFLGCIFVDPISGGLQESKCFGRYVMFSGRISPASRRTSYKADLRSTTLDQNNSSLCYCGVVIL